MHGLSHSKYFFFCNFNVKKKLNKFFSCVGQCVVSTFTLNATNPKVATVSFNALIEGNFSSSPSSVLRASSTNGVNKWDFNAVGIKPDTLDATGDINVSFVIDFVNL